MLSQNERKAKAKDGRITDLEGDIEGLRMQMMLLRRRISEVWRRSLENEGDWLKQKEHWHIQTTRVVNQALKQQSKQIVDLKGHLHAAEAVCTGLRTEKEALRTCMEEYEKEVLELRDKLSEYYHCLTSGGHLHPLLYLPAQTQEHDYSTAAEIKRRKSDNSRGTRFRSCQ